MCCDQQTVRADGCALPREVVADLVNRGSFPQLLLSPVNFEQLYAQHMQQLKDAQKQAESEPKH